MARSPIDLPRMQNQPRARVAVARAPVAMAAEIERAPKARKPRMMRQFELVDRVKQYNPDANEDLLNRAYVYAMRAHGEQKRASGDPYFSHPLQVAAILTDLKLDDATIAAALLHDTIEDTDATRAEIDRLFGHEIGHLVEGLTKLKKLDLVSKEAKQAENLRKLLLAIADDVRVLLIKLADRLHNMRTLEYRPPEARRITAEETLDIYAPLAGRMGMQEMREELEDLSFRELNPDAHKVISERLDALAERSKAWIAEIEQQLARKLADSGIAAEVTGRRKRAYSIWRKMERKAVGFEQLSDIFGFRVVVGSRGRMLSGAGHRPHHVAGRARPVQGLHFHAQAERLSLDPLHRDRSGKAACRTADPHPRDAPDRRIRHRRARALQGQRGLADRDAVARVQCLCVAAPHHRASGRRLQS